MSQRQKQVTKPKATSPKNPERFRLHPYAPFVDFPSTKVAEEPESDELGYVATAYKPTPFDSFIDQHDLEGWLFA